MPQHHDPLRLEDIDWPALLPFVHLFKSFRMAISPPKLMVALVLVVVLYLFGVFLDAVFFGARVDPQELSQFAAMSVEQFDRWRQGRDEQVADELAKATQWLATKEKAKIDGTISQRIAQAKGAIDKHYAREHAQLKQRALEHEEFLRGEHMLRSNRRDRIAAVMRLKPQGIFEAALTFKLAAFERLVNSASSLELGLGQLMSRPQKRRDTVVGALRDLLVVLPQWLYHMHRGFMIVWLLGATALWSLLGGALSRMSALHAARDRRINAVEAVHYACGKWGWYFLSPLIPLMLVLLVGLVMALGGLLFNLPFIVDVIGAILFGLALVGGFIIALLLIGLVSGANMLYPAISIEGTEAFDAISRAYHYVFFKPWQLFFYTLVSLVYGAITYLFVGAVIFLSLTVTHKFVASGVFISAAQGVDNRFDALMALPQLGQLRYDIDTSLLGSASGVVAAWLIRAWVMLLIGVLGAYAISFYFCANTWIYLLLRRTADGAEFDDIYLEDSDNRADEQVSDKVDPNPVESS